MASTCTRGPECGCGETCACVDCKYVIHSFTLLFVCLFVLTVLVLELGLDFIVFGLLIFHILVSLSACASDFMDLVIVSEFFSIHALTSS